MKKISSVIAVLLVIAACDSVRPESPLPEDSTPPETEDKEENEGQDSTEVLDYKWYATGICFPDSTHWQGIEEEQECWLTLFAEGEAISSIPIGDIYETGADPDMHRITPGHIYTWYPARECTVIKKDGEELFRYGSRERIHDMAIINGDVYTLGTPYSGKGFAFRKNGKAVSESKNGIPLHLFQNVEGRIHFSFSDEDGIFHVNDGRKERLSIEADKVWDIVWHDDGLCVLASDEGYDSPILIRNGHRQELEDIRTEDMEYARMVPAGQDLYTEIVYRFRNNSLTGLWKGTSRINEILFYGTLSGICGSDQGVYCGMNSSSGQGGGTIYSFGKTFMIPSGYKIVGFPAAVIDSRTYIGLTSVSNGNPAIWTDGDMIGIEMNGYLCRIIDGQQKDDFAFD